MLLNNIRNKNELLVHDNTGESQKNSMEQNKPGIKSTSCMIPYTMKFKNRKKQLMMLEIRGAIGSWGWGVAEEWTGKRNVWAAGNIFLIVVLVICIGQYLATYF